jgi:hypothetical protein
VFRDDCKPLVDRDAMDWQMADMTATFGADVPWNRLDHEGLWLPVDCQGRPEAPIGHLVEQNASGPLRLGWGAWRDLLLGCQFYNGMGELITAGGRTVKNVAGYDLTKFMIGQNGIFGKLATVTTRVYRKPDDAILAEFEPEMAVFNRLLASPLRPQWAVLTQNALTCGYLGTGPTVDFYARELRARQMTRHGIVADALWRCQNWRVPQNEELCLRASVPPMKIMEFAQNAKLRDWVADPAFGVVLGTMGQDSMRLVEKAASAVGGRAWFYDADRTAFTPTASERAILERLKQAMDPNKALAPLPWL